MYLDHSDLKLNKSYDDSVKLKRTEMDHFRLGLGLGNEARLEPEREPERA